MYTLLKGLVMSRDNWEKIKYKIGEGLYSDSSEEEYFGEIKNGLPDGEGIYKTSNMEDHHRVIRKGEFRKGELVEGTEEVIIGDSKSHHEGEFRDGFLDGIGKEIRYHEDGTTTVFEGEFRRGRLDGEGKKIRDKRVEEGNFKDDNLKGEGKVTFENGNVFVGDIDIKALNRNCKGVLTFTNGEYIIGIFMNHYFMVISGDKYNSNGLLIESYENMIVSKTKTLFNKFLKWNRP